MLQTADTDTCTTSNCRDATSRQFATSVPAATTATVDDADPGSVDEVARLLWMREEEATERGRDG